MENVQVACVTCGTTRKGSLKSTGNFMDHYKKSHPTLIPEVELYRKNKHDVQPLANLKQLKIVEMSTISAQEVSIKSSS